MSVTLEVDPGRPDEVAEAIRAVSEAVNAGDLVVFPTDTVYGIGCRAYDPQATNRLFEAKRRPFGLNLPVLAPSAAEALDLVVPDDAATRLAGAFWPGPLTMVLRRGDRSKNWALGEATQTIGIRVPDHALSLALLERAGSLAATSANISGGPPLHDEVALQEAFGDVVAVYIVVRPAATPSGQSSTVVDLTGPELRILREGPIDEARLAAILQARGARAARRRRT